MKNDDTTTILIAEDEQSFLQALVIGLEREGFKTLSAADGKTALDLFSRERVDMVLLDIMLPKINGIDLCKEIRRTSDVPVIMVTAKSSEIDAVLGLEVGADDYVTKPYRLRELVARIRAVLRRKSSDRAKDISLVFNRSNVYMDVDKHLVKANGREVELPLKEFDLLKILMEQAGKVVSREAIIDYVWGSDYIGDTKTLDVHIKRLRNKLESDPSSPKLITTIRRVGYRFEIL
jgi:two-component system response regulator RegX3